MSRRPRFARGGKAPMGMLLWLMIGVIVIAASDSWF